MLLLTSVNALVREGTQGPVATIPLDKQCPRQERAFQNGPNSLRMGWNPLNPHLFMIAHELHDHVTRGVGVAAATHSKAVKQTYIDIDILH